MPADKIDRSIEFIAADRRVVVPLPLLITRGRQGNACSHAGAIRGHSALGSSTPLRALSRQRSEGRWPSSLRLRLIAAAVRLS